MERELSPFSARRLLTQKLAQEENGLPRRSETRSRSRERTSRNRPTDAWQNDIQQAAPSAITASLPQRRPSPEPYRKPRERSQDKKRDSSHGGMRDGSRDRRRGKPNEPKRSRSRDGRRHRSKERWRNGLHRKESTREDRQDGDGGRHSRRGGRSRSRDRKHRASDRAARTSGSRSRSPLTHRPRKQRTRSPSTSSSPPPKRRRRTRSTSRHRAPSPHQRTKKPLPSQQVSFRGLDDSAQPPSKYGGAPPDKEKPNFKPTGALAKAANRVEGTKISLKYNEPPEARKSPPSRPWRIFVFKGPDVIDTIDIWQKSCWLLGRSREVVDYVLEHPSSSSQHAVIQFRYIQKTSEDEFGVKSKRGSVKPYIIDLESSNGTELNGESVEASRYFELRDKDILKFAGSEREYVVMLPPSEG
jgi:smad nuclear-interacting protein 1